MGVTRILERVCEFGRERGDGFLERRRREISLKT
jgi:hypothetical protein